MGISAVAGIFQFRTAFRRRSIRLSRWENHGSPEQLQKTICSASYVRVMRMPVSTDRKLDDTLARTPALPYVRSVAADAFVLALRALLEHAKINWRPLVLLVLPFAAGYYVSYLFRTINALIASRLVSDLSLGPADLGFLTSVYFLTFACIQLPLGILLDRCGPRRVQSVLLLIAAAGAALFGVATGFWMLVLARALIGLGVAAALIAGLKAIVLSFPKQRLPLVNGAFVMLGALGAVTATAPAEWLLAIIGWRGLFEWLAVATALCALVIFVVVPDRASAATHRTVEARAGFRVVFCDPRFWRLAPLSATCIGTAWALQGLWAAPFMADVEGLAHPIIVRHLFIMAVALSAGALLLGAGSDRLRRRRVSPQIALLGTAIVSIAAEIMLVVRSPIPSLAMWAVISSVGAATVLSYAIVGLYFPKEIAGHANAALNLFHIGGAFVFQSAIGLVLELWPAHAGHYPATAYQTAFSSLIPLQLAALAVFVHGNALAIATIVRRVRRRLAATEIGVARSFNPRPD
jgi:MFS family permease